MTANVIVASAARPPFRGIYKTRLQQQLRHFRDSTALKFSGSIVNMGRQAIWTLTVLFLSFGLSSGSTLGLLHTFIFRLLSAFDNVSVDQVSGACDNRTLSQGATHFALALLKNVLPSHSGTDENVFLSPISVWSALLLTYYGSRGQTKAELESVLCISSRNLDQIYSEYQVFKNKLSQKPTEYGFTQELQLANRIYVDDGINLLEDVTQYLKSDINQMKLSKYPESSRMHINDWVESQTNRRIKDFLPSGYIHAATVMIIVNAAFFRAPWQNKFIKANDADFFLSANKKMTVKMMYQKENYPFMKNSAQHFSAIKLPCRGTASVMIILPNEGTKVEDLMPELTAESWQAIQDTFKWTQVDVCLPKFKVEQSLELKGSLMAMGLGDLFSEKNADLSGFTGMKGLFADSVRHQTFLEVGEEGVEAAGATAIRYSFKSATFYDHPPEIFNVNRPFILLIHHDPTKTLLFAGVIRNPTIGL